ncbi:MAG: hypothetical protein ACKV2Q_31335 [Planctomycetaceae bacterium]
MNAHRLRRRHSLALLSAAGLALLLFGISLWLGTRDRVTIGVEGRQVVTIPGPRLSAIPYTHGDALAVRIAGVESIPNGFRYDLRYMAYGPGRHDLRGYLVDERQQPVSGLPEMTVSVAALLAKDESGQLMETPPTPIDLRTNYRWGMGLLWCLWGLLLLPLFFYGRKPRSRVVVSPPPTIPERLRTLLEQAAHSELTVEQQTDIEKLLLAFWADRLQLPRERLSETLDELRKHPAAGAHVSRVEQWLHSRSAQGNDSVARELLASLGWNNK